MQKRLARAGKSIDQYFHRLAVIAARRIDDGIGGTRFGDQQFAVFQRAHHGLHAERFERLALFGTSHQTTHVMTCVDKTRSERAAYEAACASDENVHVSFSFECTLVRSIGVRIVRQKPC